MLEGDTMGLYWRERVQGMFPAFSSLCLVTEIKKRIILAYYNDIEQPDQRNMW